MNKELLKLEEYLIDSMIATPEEVDLITMINGYSLESLEDILYARTGYRSLDQILGEEEDEDNE